MRILVQWGKVHCILSVKILKTIGVAVLMLRYDLLILIFLYSSVRHRRSKVDDMTLDEVLIHEAWLAEPLEV